MICCGHYFKTSFLVVKVAVKAGSKKKFENLLTSKQISSSASLEQLTSFVFPIQSGNECSTVKTVQGSVYSSLADVVLPGESLGSM